MHQPISATVSPSFLWVYVTDEKSVGSGLTGLDNMLSAPFEAKLA